MCRTVFLRPNQLEEQAAQAQNKSAYPSYTPYIPPHAFNLRNPVPPPPVEAVEEDKYAFKLPPGLEIVEPSSPIDDLDMDLKAPDFKVADEVEPAAEQNTVHSFALESYTAPSFDATQMSPPLYDQPEINFPSDDTFAPSGFSASPQSFDEAEELPAPFAQFESTSGDSSPVDVQRRGSMECGSMYVRPLEMKPNVHTVAADRGGYGEIAVKEDEKSDCSADTVAAPGMKGRRKGAGPRMEKWKRRDNEKHLAGERKRRANRMGKLGELKELLPCTKQKLSSIKILVAAINHVKEVMKQDKATAVAAPVPAKETQPSKMGVVDHMTFVQGMRDSNFLSLAEVDSTLSVVHCSPAFKAFLGIDEESGAGFHLSTIVHPSDYAEHLASGGFVPNSSRSLQLRFGCFLHNGHRVFVPSLVTISCDDRKCIFVINPLPTVYDHSGPGPLLVHK